MDLFVGDRLALQDGRGSFHDPDAQGPHYGPGELEDLDGDGDLDSLGLENDGRGVFEPVDGAVPPELGAGGPRFGDLDGDADADAFVPGSRPYFGGGQDRLIVNDGSGRFRLAAPGCNPSPLGDPDLTMDGALSDVDADGDLDVFLARVAPGFACHRGPCYGYAPTRLWTNDGTGCFRDASSALPTIPFDGAFAIELGDVDADGDLDALSSAGKLLLNAGDGSFADASARFVAGLAGTTVALGDADGDGDLDLFDGSQVFTNLRRSLAWRAHARIGHPLVLDLSGSPRGPYLLLGSSATRPPLPTPFGPFQLDPARILYSRAGSLDAAGRAALARNLPRDPALIGRTVYWQALLGTPVRLSNLEVVEVAGF